MPGFVRFSLVLSGEIDKVALYKTDDAVGGARNFRENLLVMKVFFNFLRRYENLIQNLGRYENYFSRFPVKLKKLGFSIFLTEVVHLLNFSCVL